MSMLANRILPAGSIPAGALAVVFRFHNTEIRPGMLEHVDIISHSFHQAYVFDHFREDANRCSTSRHVHTRKIDMCKLWREVIMPAGFRPAGPCISQDRIRFKS